MAFMSKESFSEFNQRKHREFMDKYTSSPIKYDDDEDDYSEIDNDLLSRISNLELEVKSLKNTVERLSEENSSLHAKIYMWEPMLQLQYARYSMNNPYNN